ncbi:MAG: transposase, partial [Rhodothermales bacterium]
MARGIGKTAAAASVEVFETLKARGHPQAPPAPISDGHGGIGEAMGTVYGAVPEYRGLGRPPTVKRAGADWRYLQMVKQRNEQHRVVGVEPKPIYGDEAAVQEHLGQSTAYVERTHLTMRHLSGRLTRKGLGFSKALAMHRASGAWEDAV